MIKTYDQTHACPECGSREIIQDGGLGETICEGCGLVVSEIAVNTGPEWTAVSFKEKDKRTRTGLPIRLSLHDMGLSTTFHPLDAKGKKRYEMYRLKKWHQKSNNRSHEKNLLVAMFELEGLCFRLNLPKMIKERTAIIYRKIIKKRLTMRRNISPLIAASLYAVCRMNHIPRTMEEVSRHSLAGKKEITKYYRFLIREMDIRVPVPKAKYGVSRIASGAGLSEKTQRNAIDILEEAERLKITGGMAPMAMAAAALYMACVMNGELCTNKKLSEASGVSTVTIRIRYKALKEALGEK